MECNEIEQQYEHEHIFLEIVANYYFDFILQSFLVNLSIQIEFSALFRAISHCKWTNYDAFTFWSQIAYCSTERRNLFGTTIAIV